MGSQLKWIGLHLAWWGGLLRTGARLPIRKDRRVEAEPERAERLLARLLVDLDLGRRHGENVRHLKVR